MQQAVGLNEHDQAYRRAAEAYFSEKSRRAEDLFDERLLEVFRAFEGHWRGYFAPDAPGRLREYLAVPPALRRAQFDRFRRECRSWELNFQIADRKARNGNQAAEDRTRDTFRRRVEKQNTREAEIRRLYAGLDSLLERQRRRAVPAHLLAHLRLLGVEADASLPEIKSRYRALARVHHPDRSGDAATMQRLNHAFRELLSYFKTASA